MKKLARKLVAVGLAFFPALPLVLSLPAFAFEEPKKPEKKNTNLIILPVVFYTPETRWTGGAGGLLTYRPPKAQNTSRPSSLFFALVYTQNKQFMINLKPELYLKNGDYLINGNLTFERFPNKFFGIGPNTPRDLEEDYTPRTISFDLALQKKICCIENIYVGIQYSYENFKIIKVEPGGLLADPSIPGSSGGTLSGLGFLLKLDSRDNIFYPRSGNYFQLSALLMRRLLGSDFSYNSLKLDLRKYLPVFSSQVLALQGLVQTIDGTAPFPKLSKIGGDSLMRGYYSGRFRDKILAAFQAEYRLRLWRRWSLVAFAGYAGVSDRMSHLRLADFKPSFGFGLRFKIDKKEGTNLRLDFGFGEDTSGMYFTASEAF